MLDPYRRVLAHPGAVAFSFSGFLGRLPMSMIGLGIVLQVSAQSGSYSLAGSVSAAYVLANAVVAIAQGRLIDHFGQHRLLPLAITVSAVSIALMAWSVEADWTIPLPHVFAALSGAATPPVGSCVRARWSHLLDDEQEVHTAFALEAVVDETCFVLGPTVVTLLATSWHPVAGLAAATIAGVAGTLALASQRRTEPPAGRLTIRDGARPALPWRTLAPLAGVIFALGVLFGSAEVVTVAVSEDLGHKAWAGVLLAIWSFGSLLSGLVAGSIVWTSSTTRRLRLGLVSLTVLMAPMVVIDSLWVLAPMLFLAGFAISPTLIATMSLAEHVLPRARLTEGMSVLQTGIAAGVALGAALAGVVIDGLGPSTAYLVTVGGGVLGGLAALVLPGERPADS
ncbi:Major facilitator superfamily MFS_1 [metagenome]|uniref:Major facilitator superfamily MFS_1 n=1 Tax=metagenome TaxID=256318 RepID=A0A2P2BYF6_9ZZZZ